MNTITRLVPSTAAILMVATSAVLGAGVAYAAPAAPAGPAIVDIQNSTSSPVCMETTRVGGQVLWSSPAAIGSPTGSPTDGNGQQRCLTPGTHIAGLFDGHSRFLDIAVARGPVNHGSMSVDYTVTVTGSQATLTQREIGPGAQTAFVGVAQTGQPNHFTAYTSRL